MIYLEAKIQTVQTLIQQSIRSLRSKEVDFKSPMKSLAKTFMPLAAIGLLALPVLNANAEDIVQRFEVQPNGELTIDSENGSIDISTWDEYSVDIRVKNGSDYDVDIVQSGNNVSIIAEREGSFLRRRRSLGFEVRVPTQYSVDLNTGGGHINVDDLQGNVIADTSGGHIELGDIIGDVTVDTSGGHITIGDVDGEVYADTSGGRIRIGNVNGDIRADTSGGSIEVGEAQGEVDLNTSGGSIRAGYAQGPVRADTSGGNIRLEGSATAVYADTSGGNIEINGSNGPIEADTAGGNIEINNAAGEVSADTSGGRVEVHLLPLAPGADGDVDIETSGGDVTLSISSGRAVTIHAELDVSRRSRGDYRIYTDFPLSVNDDDGHVIGRGDVNGGGDRVNIEASNGDIHINAVD